MEKEKVEVLDEEKKSKNNGLGPGFMVILVVLFLIGIGLGFAAAKVIDLDVKEDPKEEEKEKKEKKEEPVVTNYAVTDEKVAKLIDNILKYKPGVMCGRITLLAMDKKFGVNDIDNDGAWSIAMTDLGSKDTITLDEVNNTVKKYLGKDYVFKTAAEYSSYCSGIYEYDESTKTFNKKPFEGGCGGTCGPASSSYRMVKAVDTDGILKIDVKVVFGSEGISTGNQYDFYSDYARTNVIGNANQTSVENLYDKGSNYQFTFKLEDGNYVFVSSEPVK